MLRKRYQKNGRINLSMKNKLNLLSVWNKLNIFPVCRQDGVWQWCGIKHFYCPSVGQGLSSLIKIYIERECK